MAFNYTMQVASSIVTNSLGPNPTAIEFGNQRFRYSEETLDICERVVQRKIRRPVEFVWEFFEDIGYVDYAAIDVNDALRAIPMDLNYNLKEKYGFTKQYDLVTNNGTGEHIFDQRTVFENMHNLCKVGGAMICILPLAPWVNHGFFNFHPILWRDLVAANNYQWVLLWIGGNTGRVVDTELKDWAFYEEKNPTIRTSELQRHLQTLTNDQNASIVAAYIKTEDKPFSVPMQGRYVDDAQGDIRSDYNNPDTRQDDHSYDHLRPQREE